MGHSPGGERSRADRPRHSSTAQPSTLAIATLMRATRRSRSTNAMPTGALASRASRRTREPSSVVDIVMTRLGLAGAASARRIIRALLHLARRRVRNERAPDKGTAGHRGAPRLLVRRSRRSVQSRQHLGQQRARDVLEAQAIAARSHDGAMELPVGSAIVDVLGLAHVRAADHGVSMPSEDVAQDRGALSGRVELLVLTRWHAARLLGQPRWHSVAPTVLAMVVIAAALVHLAVVAPAVIGDASVGTMAVVAACLGGLVLLAVPLALRLRGSRRGEAERRRGDAGKSVERNWHDWLLGEESGDVAIAAAACTQPQCIFGAATVCTAKSARRECKSFGNMSLRRRIGDRYQWQSSSSELDTSCPSSPVTSGRRLLAYSPHARSPRVIVETSNPKGGGWRRRSMAIPSACTTPARSRTARSSTARAVSIR